MATLPETSTEEGAADVQAPATSRMWRALSMLVRMLLVIVILGVSGYISYQWLQNPPVAQRRPPQREAALVEVMPAQVQTVRATVRNMGTVVPARTVDLAARIRGQISQVAPTFLPGGHFALGEILAEIEANDYELAVEQQRANLVKAQSELKLEMGQQSIAQLEYELLGESAPEEDEALMLRQPQLESKKAAVAIAQAGLNQARLDLERTVLVAPFNAVIQERKVDLGAYVNPGTALATLVDSDEFWVEVTVPVAELRWLEIPGFNSTSGSLVRIFHEDAWGAGIYREGEVQRILSDIESGSTLPRILVAVKDPLQLNNGGEAPSHPLLLGAKVRVEIVGQEVPDVCPVPASAVREGNYVWVMTPDKALEIRSIEMAWRGAESTYVSHGVEHGELIVMSELSTPVDGMPLRLREEGQESSPVPAGNTLVSEAEGVGP
ncbi:MAG: efflux RND transporter periplasmic adaptor subunit [Candidatus Hydrogenedentales bacterium]|jgi:RND family efflux transporter MFP subunit